MVRNPTMLAGLAALAALAACAQREVILPGERLGVREALQTGAPEAPKPPDTARPAALPAPVRNAAWPQSPVSPHVRTDHAALNTALRPAWSVDIGQGDVKRQRLNTDPVTDGARIYTMSSNFRVSAVAPGGQVVWTRDLTPLRDDDYQAQGGGLAVSGGRLYVATGFGMLAALDAANGAEVWVQDLPSSATGAPTVLGDLVFVTSGDSIGYAVETAQGRIRWTAEGLEDIDNVAGAPPPALAQDRAVFAYGDGTLRASFRQGGMSLWTADLAGRRNGRVLASIDDVTGDPVIAGTTVYAGSHSGRFAAFDLGSGERRWTLEEGALDRPLVAGDSVYFVSDLNELLRVDAASGQQVWSAELPGWVPTRRPSRRRDRAHANHGPVLAGGLLWVASTQGGLLGYAPEDGRLAATVPVPGGATTAPIVANGTLYVVSTRGQLHAFR